MNDPRPSVITGATGLLGSHIAELLVARGEPVRAVVRSSSDTTWLRGLGIDIAEADIKDPAAVRRAVAGARIVYHCAARVGDWGTWDEFHAGTVETTRHVAEACREAKVDRLLHVSSVAAYGHPAADKAEYTEDEPLGQNLWLFWDYYARSKREAEAEARQLGQGVTIVRPTWIYGPRDRAVIPRMLKAISKGRVRVVGRGDNLLNMVYASDVAEGAVLAANHPGAAGETYNLSSAGEITQQQLLNTLCDALGRPHVTTRVPQRAAFRIAMIMEIIGWVIRLKRAPYVTRQGVSLITRPTQFSSRKAREELGWSPRVSISEGLQRTLQWMAEHGLAAEAGATPGAPAARQELPSAHCR